VSPVKYELGFYIPGDILRSHRRENLKSYMAHVTEVIEALSRKPGSRPER
jgi:hypothetical protein